MKRARYGRRDMKVGCMTHHDGPRYGVHREEQLRAFVILNFYEFLDFALFQQIFK